MSRSDGEFPTYNKLDIDEQAWPEDYWDTARQCRACGFNWPHLEIFDPSPCCGKETAIVEYPPEIRWPDAVRRLHLARFERFYDEYNEGLADDQLVWEELISNGEVDEDKFNIALEKIQINELERGTS